MNDSKFFLNNLWRWKCGLEEEEYNKKVIDRVRVGMVEGFNLESNAKRLSNNLILV